MELLIPARFRGPARSGNGGWSAGALAARAPWPTVTVRLSAPPPLDTAMAVQVGDEALVASYDGPAGRTEVLRATPAGSEPTPVPFVTVAEAREAEARYPGLDGHPFPTCFVCGTGRDDGLRIFSGPVREGVSAATWTPGDTGVETTWASLDCPGAWAADVGERTMVLGTMTTHIDSLPALGAEHVVVGELRERRGRRSMTATSLYDASGTLLGTAEHVWIDVDPSVFN